MLNMLDDLLTCVYIFFLGTLLFMYGILIKLDLSVPKYYDMKFKVIRIGHYRPHPQIILPKSYVVIQSLTDSTLITNLDSLTFPPFIANKYKIGDILYFEFINKNRF